jgi:transcriptional regulator with XRE-family HTH domain
MLSRVARKREFLDSFAHEVPLVTEWADVRARLKAARAAKGWTQKQLADAIGVTPTRIGQLETSIPPGEKVLTQIAAALDRSVAWLRYGVADEHDAVAERRAGYLAGRLSAVAEMRAALDRIAAHVGDEAELLPDDGEEGGDDTAHRKAS